MPYLGAAVPHPLPRRVVIVRVAVAAVAIVAVAVAGVAVAVSLHQAPGTGRQATPPATSTTIGAPLSPGASLPLADPPSTLPPPPELAPPVTALAGQLDPILVNTNSCLLVRGATGQLLYEHQPATALAPASTQKLLVAAAALELLGPSFRFTTTVVATQHPVAGEVDNAWLVGSGDPVLSSPEYTSYLALLPFTAGQPVTTPLVSLATQLAADGVRSIPGGIHGDDSLFDRTRFLPTWTQAYITEGDVAPIGALEVDDGLDSWRPVKVTADPAAHAAGVLARLATAAGIATVQGADGVAPPGAVVLASVQSPTLADIITSMLRVSDNTTAEMLVREVDRVTGGTGTTAGGVAVVMREAAALGLPTAGLHLVDGSGLSPEDRVSCVTLLDALDLASQDRFAAMGLLSVAGRFGTLVDRFTGTPAADHLEAKTGNIADVYGLVGRLDEGSPLSFAFLINGPLNYVGGIGYENRVVAALGTYPA